MYDAKKAYRGREGVAPSVLNFIKETGMGRRKLGITISAAWKPNFSNV